MSAFCASNTQTPTSQVKYINGQCEVQRELPTFRLAPDVVTGYPLYSGANQSKTGFYLMVNGKDTWNLVPNPTFFSSLGDWEKTNVSAIRQNIVSYDSGFSLRLAGTGDTTDPANLRAYVETEIEGFVPGVKYTASGYLWQPLEFDNEQDLLMGTISIVQQVRDANDNVITETEFVSDTLKRVGKWERIAVSLTLDEDTTNVFLRLNLRGDIKRQTYPPYDPILNDNGDQVFNSIGEFIYFDMLQFEQGDMTTPFHGSTSVCGEGEGNGACDNYKWEGKPHGSASFRSKCARDGGTLVSLSDLGFEILSHGGHDGMAVTNLSQPFNNRPGSHYQKSLLGDRRTLTFASYTCSKTLKELECNIYQLQDLIMPEVGGCNGKFLLVYHHEECCADCDADRELALCVVYSGGFEYSRDNLFQQRIVLQFEAFDPLAWFSYPGNTGIGLNFAKAIPGNKVIRLHKEGDYTTYPIDRNKDFTDIACMPATNEFVLGGEFEGINGTDDSENLALYSCNESCTSQMGRPTRRVNVLEHAPNGDVIIGGTNLSIIFSEDHAEGTFQGYPGGEVWAIDTPFWASVAVGTDDAIHLQLGDGSWLTWATNGRVNDLKTDNNGVIYAVGEFTEIDGQTFNRAAKFAFEGGNCLDVTTGSWQSIGYGLDDTMNSLTIDRQTNTVYMGGLANNATPDLATICNDVIGQSTDSKGKGFGCNSSFNEPGYVWVDGTNPQTVFTTLSGSAIRCDMFFIMSSDGTITPQANPNSQLFTLTTNDNFISLQFQFPVENVVLSLDQVDQGETFTGFNVRPSSTTGDLVLANNFVTSNINAGTGTMVWDGPITLIEIDYQTNAGLGAFDNIIGLAQLDYDQVSGGNNQQFKWSDLGGGITRFELALSNAIASDFIESCLTDPVTALQRRFVRVTANNTQGIAYTFLIGDDNLVAINTQELGGFYLVALDVDTTATLAAPCNDLNLSLAQELAQTGEDLALYQTLVFSGGLGIDNLLSSITIQCLTLDVYFQGDNVQINHVAALSGENLTGLGDGISTEVYDVMFNPDTRELWAGYDGGLQIWNGQDWFQYPGQLSGSVINMDYCDNSGDVYLLTDQDGAHVMAGITEVDYRGNFEQLSGRLIFQGPGLLEYILDGCENKQARFCAKIECDEVATLGLDTGSFMGSRDFNNTVLSGSRLDFWLKKCGQKLSMYVSGDEAATSATFLYQNHFWGINAICCIGRNADGTESREYQDIIDNATNDDGGQCCHYEFSQHRNPSDEDCEDQGYKAGDTWLNVNGECGTARLFVYQGGDCGAECEDINSIRATGGVVLAPSGDTICLTSN